MKAKFVNEAIKHLTPKSKEEKKRVLQNILDEIDKTFEKVKPIEEFETEGTYLPLDVLKKLCKDCIDVNPDKLYYDDLDDYNIHQYFEPDYHGSYDTNWKRILPDPDNSISHQLLISYGVTRIDYEPELKIMYLEFGTDVIFSFFDKEFIKNLIIYHEEGNLEWDLD